MALEYKINLRILGAYNVEFTEEDISLGTQIKETLDKTHGTISVEVLMQKSSKTSEDELEIDMRKEFQPYTPTTFVIYDTDDNGYAKDVFYRYMIVESDEVNEIYIGSETRYTHKIVLIDATKLLETELMPNMTFTQPIKNASLGQIYEIPTVGQQLLNKKLVLILHWML